MYNTAMSPEEKKWRRQSDARTLAEAEVIKADKERLAEAKEGARELLSERQKDLNGLAKVAQSSRQHTNRGGQKQSPSNGGILDRRSNPAKIGDLF